MTAPAVYRLPAAAAMLGLSSGDVLRRQIRRGKLAGKKLGRDWYVTARELRRYQRENRRAS